MKKNEFILSSNNEVFKRFFCLTCTVQLPLWIWEINVCFLFFVLKWMKHSSNAVLNDHNLFMNVKNFGCWQLYVICNN